MVLGLTSILSGITGLMQGFGFGAGYGSGVRFGYQDLYPAIKSLVSGTHGSFFGSGLLGGLGLDLPEVMADKSSPAGLKPTPLKVDTSGLGFEVGSAEYKKHKREYYKYQYGNPFY